MKRIEVVSFDQYVNQLVRNAPRSDFAHLGKFANDVRYPVETACGGRRFWEIKYGQELEELLGRAMGEVARKYPSQRDAYYLDGAIAENLAWMVEELHWLEARYEDVTGARSPSSGKEPYVTASRIGRGIRRRPSEDIRMVILEVWGAYRSLLEESRFYTVEQAVKRLMKSKELPRYDAIAIDEVQDFSLISIKLLVKFRAGDKSRVYISGDENQKIYQRDFTWKELDSSIRGHTITLGENKRNDYAIRNFAERLNGRSSSYDDAKKWIHVTECNEERVVALMRSLSEKEPGTTTAIIGNVKHWVEVASRNGVRLKRPERPGKVTEPGLYAIGEFAGKGLEFDNVIVDYDRTLGEDMAAEKRLRYVHFSRARHRLYVRFQG